MKVAVPTRGNMVDDHFGHCEAYTVFTVGASNQIKIQRCSLLRKVAAVKAISQLCCSS